MRAVNAVTEKIAPLIKGMDTTQQTAVDEAMLKVGKDVLGGNATGAVSAAVLKAGAASLGIPLYQHIGGTGAYTLPVPGVGCLGGSRRYGGGSRSGGKPSHAFMAYDFETFSDASYALWDLRDRWSKHLWEKHGLEVGGVRRGIAVPPGYFNSDMEIWDQMTELINKHGYQNKIGIQIDIASDTYFEKETGKFEGLFSKKPMTHDELLKFLINMPQTVAICHHGGPASRGRLRVDGSFHKGGGHPGRRR